MRRNAIHCALPRAHSTVGAPAHRQERPQKRCRHGKTLFTYVHTRAKKSWRPTLVLSYFFMLIVCTRTHL